MQGAFGELVAGVLPGFGDQVGGRHATHHALERIQHGPGILHVKGLGQPKQGLHALTVDGLLAAKNQIRRTILLDCLL